MDKKKLLYNTSIVLIIFSFNKILGFFRETLIAAKYGASISSDSFYFALSIAGMLLVVSSAFTHIMKPITIKILKVKGIKESEKYFSSLLYFIMTLLLVICILVAIFAKPIIGLFGYGFSKEKIDLIIMLFRILLISSFSISISTIYSAYFDCRKMFIASAFESYLFNIISISFLLLFATVDNIILFTYIYAFGQIFRLIYYNIILAKKDFSYKITESYFKNKKVRNTAKLALPLLLGNLSGIVNRLVDRILASTLKVGSIASLKFADNLTSIFSGLVLTAIMKVVFPSLTEISLDDKVEYKKKTSQILNYTLFLTIPVVAAFIVFSKTLVIVVYEHGLFNSNDTIIVAEIVVVYSLAMLFSSLNFTMGRFFYINKQTKIILISGLIGFVLNVLFNLVLIKTYKHNGLAIATLIASFARTIFMLYIMYFRNKALLLKENLKCLYKTVIATIIMISGAYGISRLLYQYMFAGKILNEIIGILIISFTGIIIYIVSLYLLKSDELNYFIPKKIKNMLKG